MAERKIKYDFYEMSKSGRAPIPKGCIEVRFFYSNCTTNPAVINNVWRLNGFNQYTAGTTIKNPFELVLVNNKDEVDDTDYNVQMTEGDTIQILVKYFKD